MENDKTENNPTKKVVLALDPAEHTGYCLIEITPAKNRIFEYGSITVDTSSNYQGDHCHDLTKKLIKLIRKYSVTEVAVEDYFFSNKTRQGSNVNAAYRTAIHMMCRSKKINIPYIILNISGWKTYIAGASRPTKEQKKKWGKDPSKKLYIQEALFLRRGFRFPNHTISEKTGKPIIFQSDPIDAVAQGIFYCEMILGYRGETVMEVIPPPDIKFKKESKKMFIYPS